MVNDEMPIFLEFSTLAIRIPQLLKRRGGLFHLVSVQHNLPCTEYPCTLLRTGHSILYSSSTQVS